MTTTPVGNGQTVSNQEVTNGNTLDVQSGGAAAGTKVDNGGTLEIDSGGAETNATILAGGTETLAGTINGSNAVTQNASSTGDDIFGTVNVSSGGVVNNATVENGGSLNLVLKAASANNVTVNSGGILTINGNAPANNVTLQGGTLELQSPKADSTNTTAGQPTASGSLTFASGSNSSLIIQVAQTGGNATTFAQTLAGFANGDVVDLQYLTAAGASLTQTQNGTSTNVTVTGGGSSGSESFTLANTTAGLFSLAPDSGGTGTDLVYAVTCFASGTFIRTERGEVEVGDLVVGDRVVTSSGAFRPIRWLGHRKVDCRRHPRPHEAFPVRITAHAIGENRPVRDLWLSPGHSVCLDLLGEVLIPAHALVNGTTIVQEEVESVTYWHVELDSHDILLAENLPCESYLEMGNRGFFAEGGVVDLAASPDAAVPTHADFCHPFHQDGSVVAFAQQRLTARLAELGWSLTHEPLADLHLVVDGVRVEPDVDGLSARFLLPAGADEVWLVSETSVPAEVGVAADLRRLGVCVGGLVVNDGFESPRVVSADDPLLSVGFHQIENGPKRWTCGRARLPAMLWEGCRGSFFLRLDLARPGLPRWVAPARQPVEKVVALAG